MPQQRVDDEPLRLVTSFNDVFVVIAAWMVVFGIYKLTGTLPSWQRMLIVAALMWGLSELFVRRRRMALPALLFSALFVSNFALLGINNASYAFHGDADLPNLLSAWSLIATCAGAALGAVIYWWRFRVPAVAAMGVGAIVIAVGVHILILAPSYSGWLMFGSIAAGLLIFVWAMRLDAQDLQRTTLHSDVAFWLHLLAACMVTHPVLSMLMDAHPAAIITAFLALTVVSLIIDRRALMLSSVIYLLNAILRILVGPPENHSEFGVGFSAYLPVVALSVGGVLLLLSGFWQPSRKVVLRAMPANWRARLPR